LSHHRKILQESVVLFKRFSFSFQTDFTVSQNAFATRLTSDYRWETTRHNKHNELLPAPTCYGLATGKLVKWNFGLWTQTPFVRLVVD